MAYRGLINEMGLRRHLLDFSGTSIASAIATGADAAVYAAMVVTLVHTGAISVGVAAGAAAALGGLIHYGLCRFWVFRRFQASIPSSLMLYLTMSWLAAVGHGVLTQWLSEVVGVAAGWLISKSILWVVWTYPLSRFVVFYDGDSSANGH